MSLSEYIQSRDPAILDTLAELGMILSEPAPEYPRVGKIVIEFCGGNDEGEITDIDLYPPGEDTRPIHPDIALLMLETIKVEGQADKEVTLGEALDAIAFGLLKARHPRWTRKRGAWGEIELSWTQTLPGQFEPEIGGTIEYRKAERTPLPFWAEANWLVA
jgi:hypothetical protein